MLIDPNGLLVQGFILATGVIGQMYVAHLNVKGFYYWAASNIALIAVSLHFGGYGMVGLYAYFFIMAIYSILHWKKRQDVENLAKAQHAELLCIASLFLELADTDDKSQMIAVHVARAKAILQENKQSLKIEAKTRNNAASFKMTKASA